MKRIILISLVSFALSSYGDDRVTKEYFVGDWRCKHNQYKRYNVRANDDLGDPMSSIDNIRTFRIIDNELYQISKKHENTLIDLNKIDAVKDEISDTYKKHMVNTFEEIDKDTFNDSATMDIKHTNNDTNIIDIRIKLEDVCTRIK